PLRRRCGGAAKGVLLPERGLQICYLEKQQVVGAEAQAAHQGRRDGAAQGWPRPCDRSVLRENRQDLRRHRGTGGRWEVRQFQAGVRPAERRKTMKLSLYEQETIILYNQAEATAEVYTHDPRLLEKLRRLAEKYPEQIVKKDQQTFTVPKRCVSVREPYSAERRKAASERAKAAGYRPPTPKKGSE